MKKLGARQSRCLRRLTERSNGAWYPGCGWVWSTSAETEAIFLSLVKHGFVTNRTSGTGSLRRVRFEITQAGRDWIQAATAIRKEG